MKCSKNTQFMRSRRSFSGNVEPGSWKKNNIVKHKMTRTEESNETRRDRSGNKMAGVLAKMKTKRGCNTWRQEDSKTSSRKYKKSRERKIRNQPDEKKRKQEERDGKNLPVENAMRLDKKTSSHENMYIPEPSVLIILQLSGVGEIPRNFRKS